MDEWLNLHFTAVSFVLLVSYYSWHSFCHSLFSLLHCSSILHCGQSSNAWEVPTGGKNI